jgi:hypothetical protein
MNEWDHWLRQPIYSSLEMTARLIERRCQFAGVFRVGRYNCDMVQHPAWNLIIIGVLIAGIGLVWLFAPSVSWLGKLPGDIVIQRETFRFYFPIVTCIMVSLLLMGIVWLVRYLSR